MLVSSRAIALPIMSFSIEKIKIYIITKKLVYSEASSLTTVLVPSP